MAFCSSLGATTPVLHLLQPVLKHMGRIVVHREVGHRVSIQSHYFTWSENFIL